MAKITLAAESSYSPTRLHRPAPQQTGIRDVIAAIQALGYDAALADAADGPQGQIAGLTRRQAEETRQWRRYFVVACCLTLPMMLVMWLAPPAALAALHAPWQCGGAWGGMGGCEMCGLLCLLVGVMAVWECVGWDGWWWFMECVASCACCW